MASRRLSRKPPAGLCSAWGADDGIDPRLTPARPHGSVTNRKALQLCRQVERILSCVLEGDLLRDLSVQTVLPAPDSSRLLATFVFHGPEAIETSEILAALHGAQARLRAELASGIHRKKTPELAFQVMRSQCSPLAPQEDGGSAA